MLQNTQGLILRTIKYSETSVICDVFTKEYGLRTYILNGVRKQKAKIGAALLRPMSWVDLVVYHREDKEINRVKEVQPAFLYHKIPYNIVRGAIGLFMTELAQKSIKEAVANPPLYQFLSSAFELLDTLESRLANFHLSFMVQLTRYLGFMPDSSTIENNINYHFDYKDGYFLEQTPAHRYYFEKTTSRILIELLSSSMAESTTIRITGALRHQFIEDMIHFYQYNIDNFQLQSHDILHQVLS